jgi:spermidine/putrescine transport system permease protein
VTAVAGSRPVEGATSVAPGGPARRILGLFDRFAVPVFTAAALIYLMIPILVMIAFSFNDPPGRFNYVWGELSLDAWLNPFGRPGLQDAIVMSVIIATLSTIAATALGTLIALALTRYDFRGRSGTNLFLFIPMATPEIVLGASLLTMFVGTAQEPLRTLTGGLFFPLGSQTILIAHIMFNISFVVVTVRARMQGFPRHLEEAAMDLGANGWTTFWKVTFPLILPGIMAAALLAFSLSIDDFVITQFTAGTEQTFPLWVWGSTRASLPPQVHVIGTMVFVGAVGLVALSTVYERWVARRDERIAREDMRRFAPTAEEAAR